MLYLKILNYNPSHLISSILFFILF